MLIGKASEHTGIIMIRISKGLGKVRVLTTSNASKNSIVSDFDVHYPLRTVDANLSEKTAGSPNEDFPQCKFSWLAICAGWMGTERGELVHEKLTADSTYRMLSWLGNSGANVGCPGVFLTISLELEFCS